MNAPRRNTSLRLPRPGHTFALGSDNRLYEVPVSADAALQRSHALGDLPPQSHPTDAGSADKLRNDPDIRSRFTVVPMFYPATCELGGDEGDVSTASVTLRPESFIIERVTWATTGDVLLTGGEGSSVPTGAGGSAQGRTVLASWSDEFTKFVGNDTPTLISALFGDSQGFLDLPRGLLIQGKQTLAVKLTRLFWPGGGDPETTRWDFIFHGVGLLSKGVNQSGSAG